MYYSNLYLFIPEEQFPNCVREAVFALKSAGISTTPTPPSQDLRNERAKLESHKDGLQPPFQTFPPIIG